MTNISTLNQVIRQTERITAQQAQLDLLSSQIATGRKTQQFSGLDNQILSSQRTRASIDAIDTFIDNMTNSENRINLTLGTIEEFQQQAGNFAAALATFNQESAQQKGEPVYEDDDPLTPEIENDIIGYTSGELEVDFASLKDLASNLFDFVSDLLNTRFGDRFILSGADARTAPIGDTSALTSAMGSLINDWKNETITSEELLADLNDRTIEDGNTDAITDTIIGYSATLSSNTAGRTFVRVSEQNELDTTVFANDEGFRDILVALSYFASDSLGPIADVYDVDPVTGVRTFVQGGSPGTNVDEMTDNFYEIFNEISLMVNNALDEIDEQRFKLETVRSRIDQLKTNYASEKNLLFATIDQVENVDINEASLKLNNLITTMEISFAVTGRVQQLSLINFL